MIKLIGLPDVTIVLYASVDTRLKRLHERDSDDYDLKDYEKHVFGYDKMYKFLDDFHIPYFIVDTENKSIDEVLKAVNDIVSKYK
jgi:cytidylate kinase